MRHTLMGVAACVGGALVLLYCAKAVLAGNSTECRTYAEASPKTPYAIGSPPPQDPSEWEPADPTDPNMGIKCEKLACTETCHPTHYDMMNPPTKISCYCGEEYPDEESCHIIATLGPGGGFGGYQCTGGCENEQTCTGKVSNERWLFTSGGPFVVADVECVCQ